MRTVEDVALLVAQARYRKGWSRNQLAGAAHVSPDTVKDLESGKVSTKLDTFLRIIGALDVDVITVYNQADAARPAV